MIELGRSRFIYGDHFVHARWLEAMIPGCKMREDTKCIGHERGGRLVAVCGFDTFAQNDCMVTIASDGSFGSITREFLTVGFAFPFLQEGFSRITSLVRDDNHKTLRFIQKLGFELEGRLRKAGPNGSNLWLFGMLREECRFIPNAIDPSPLAEPEI